MKQFVERGLDKAGIKLIGPGDVTDDDLLPRHGRPGAIGTVTAHFYWPPRIRRPMNKAYVEAFKKANNGFRPNFMSVGGYDGMHLIYEALKKTGGKTDGDALIAAMKGMKWESPRGPISIDPGDARHRAEHLHPQGREGRTASCYNVEFATFEARQGPGEGGEEVARRQRACVTARDVAAKWAVQSGCSAVELRSHQAAC